MKFVHWIFLLLSHCAFADSSTAFHLAPFSDWKLVNAIPFPFNTFHAQGLLKIRDTFFMSTVDRNENMGYFIKFELDSRGKQIKELQRVSLKDGPRYHPGGIDQDRDGEIWVPLAEYRASSTAVILKISPDHLKTSPVASFPDHVGTLIVEPGILRMVNWDVGIYSIPLNPDYSFPPESGWKPFIPPNNGDYGGFEYQDCKSVAPREALCTGVKSGFLGDDGVVDLIGFKNQVIGQNGVPYLVLHRVHVPRVNRRGQPSNLFSGDPSLSENPMAYELISTSPSMVRLYFVPHDGPNSALLIYDVKQQ